MHFPKVLKEELIDFVSLILPLDFLILSLPAKSTKYKIDETFLA